MKKLIGLLLIFIICTGWIGLLILYSLSNLGDCVSGGCNLQAQTCHVSYSANSPEFISLNKAQEALRAKKYTDAIYFADEIIDLYNQKAQEMQSSLTEYPWESKEKIISYKALNATGVALFVKGKAYHLLGNDQKAKEALSTLTDQYYYAQCWIPDCGMFPKPAEEAHTLLDKIQK